MGLVWKEVGNESQTSVDLAFENDLADHERCCGWIVEEEVGMAVGPS